MLWFADAVLPQVQAHEPAIHFQIVGMNPHPRLERLRHHPAITITGMVESPLPYVQGAAVYVVPMRVGGGTRFKVLEAMASAKAIVSTSLGVEGIGVQHGQELLLADDAPTFAAAVVDLLRDQRQGARQSHRLGHAPRSFVQGRYTWESIMPRLTALYARLVDSAGAKGSPG